MKNTKIPILYIIIPIIALAIYGVLLYNIDNTDSSLKVGDLSQVTLQVSGYEMLTNEDNEPESIVISASNYPAKFSIDITEIKNIDELKEKLTSKKIKAEIFIAKEEKADNPESIIQIYAMLLGDISVTNIDIKYNANSKAIVFLDSDKNELSSPDDYIRADKTKDPVVPLIYLAILAIGILYPMFLYFKKEHDNSELILTAINKEKLELDFNFIVAKSNKMQYFQIVLLSVLIAYQLLSAFFDINPKFYSADTNLKFILLVAWFLIQSIYQSRKSDVKYFDELSEARVISYEIKKHKFNYEFYFAALKCEIDNKIINTFIPYFTRKEKYALGNISNYIQQDKTISLAKRGEVYTPDRFHKTDISYLVFIDVIIGTAFIIKIFIGGF